jgi:hypothetical protein
LMTPRERFNAVTHFRKPDVLPWCELIEDETLIAWFTEGLPAKDMAVYESTLREGRPLTNFAAMGLDPYTYFGCQNPFGGCYVPVDLGPLPRFKQRILREDDRSEDRITEIGSVRRRSKRAKYAVYSMPMYLEFPVKDRHSWDEYVKRLNPENPCRYPKDWNGDDYIKVFESHQAGATSLVINGFYGFGAELMGIPNYVTAFYKEPELMRRIADHWEYFTLEAIRDAVETLKKRIDYVFWWEDLAEKHGPNISPKIFREFFLPHYRKVTDFLRRNSIDRIMMDSDGNTNALLDLVIEAGITGHWPLEVNSGMDAVSLKKKYGERLFLMGNLDKRELAKGGEPMRREVDSKVPLLKEMGGYMPGVDHGVHVEFTLARFREYAEHITGLLPY